MLTHGTPAETNVPGPRSLFRGIVIGSGLYSISLVGQKLISLVLLTITTRFLQTSDFGVLELLEQTITIVTMLLGLNVASALGYFYSKEETPEGRARTVGTTLGGGFLIGAGITLVGWISSPWLSLLVFGTKDYAPYMALMFAALPFGMVAEVGMAWLRVENRPKTFVGMALGRSGITFVVAAVLIGVLGLRVWGMLITNLFVSTVLGVGLTVLYYRAAHPGFDWKLLVRMIRFSVPMGLSGVAVFLIHFGDRFVLTRYLPLGEIGIYGVAYKLGMIIAMVQASFETYWSAQVYQIARREDAKIVMARVFSYLTWAMCFSGLALVFATRPGLSILAPPAYSGAAVLVPIIVAAYVVRALGDFFRTMFYVANRPVNDAICNWIGAGLCIVGYLTLIPVAGTRGAAYATLLGFSLIGVIAAIWAYRVRPYEVEGIRLLKIAVATAVAVAGFAMLPAPLSLVPQIGWGVLWLLVQPVVLIGLGFFTPGEREMLRSLPARIKEAI